MVALPEPAPPTLMSRVLSLVTLAPAAGDSPPAPGESPLFLSFMAAGRRVSQQASVEEESSLRTADIPKTSLMLTMVVVANSAPTVAPSKAAPVADTGLIVGNVNANDLDNDPLTYSVASATTPSTTTFAQVKAATPPTQQSGRAPGGDTTAPTVSLTAPTNNATVSGTVTVSANASDNKGVVGVQFLLNGAALGTEDKTAAYSVSWNTTTVTNGDYTLTAVARDAADNKTTSAPVTVTVDNTAPTVNITAPANNATVSGTVSLTAGASDNVGVTRVQFLDGANLIAEDTSSTGGWGVSWNTATATNGAHTLTARAYDAAGNTTTSSAVSVTVDNDTRHPR